MADTTHTKFETLPKDVRENLAELNAIMNTSLGFVSDPKGFNSSFFIERRVKEAYVILQKMLV